jgi:hypothetical protein
MAFWKKLLLLPSLIAVLIICFFVFKANAQAPASFDLTVSPVFFDLSANPGDNLTNKIRVRNNTQEDAVITIGLKKFTSDSNGDLTLSDLNDNTISWIKFKSNTFVAKTNEWVDVPFEVSIPKDAAFGYYWAVTLSETANGTTTKTGTQLTGVSAIPILLDVKKQGAKAEGKIVEFKTSSYINEYLPVDFTVRVQNTGNIHIRPQGNIFLRGGGDKDLAILNVNNAQGAIIPNGQRSFIEEWSDGFLVREPIVVDGQAKLDKNGKPEQKLTINWDKLTSFRIGKYTADVILVFDNGTRDVSMEAKTDFWVFPYKIIGGILISLIIFIIIVRLILKAYIKKAIKSEKIKEI